MPKEQNTAIFPAPTWALVEVMGHHKLAGQITEVSIAGQGMLRVDVPPLPAVQGRPEIAGYTRFLAPGALYAITPCDELTALHAVAYFTPRPIDAWTASQMLETVIGDEPDEPDDGPF
jgi:hypothetical protein